MVFVFVSHPPGANLESVFLLQGFCRKKPPCTFSPGGGEFGFYFEAANMQADELGREKTVHFHSNLLPQGIYSYPWLYFERES